MPPGTRLVLLLLAALGLGSLALAQPAGPDYADVQAIFAERCTLCHTGQGAPLGLDLTTYDAVMAGSVNGPVVVPNDPDASELVRRIRGTSTPRMPLAGPPFLSDEQIGTIERWIGAGAPGPGSDGDGDPSPDQAADDGDDGDDGAAAAEPGPRAEPAPGTFAHVEAILLQRCASCHSAQGVMGPAPEGLVLTSWRDVIAGGERVVIVPGSSAASELVRRIEGWSLPRMPFDGPPYLEPEQIESIRRWVELGAPAADGEPAPLPVGAEVRLGGTLTSRWELDGLPLETTADTRFDDDPRVGSYVEVRGVVTADGGILATRIRTR